jgi:N-formylglutamate amidohydrolase
MVMITGDASFQLHAPEGPEIPVVVEVPHAGTDVPPRFLAPLIAPARCIGCDADLFVDRLYADAPKVGATLLVARVSRYVVDLNRSEEDVDAEVVEGARLGQRFNHGLVWRSTSDGDRALARPITRAELEDRLETVYRPYHRALRAELERKRARFGFAVLLAAHSMPSVGRPTAGAPGSQRADVVPGTRGRTSADARYIEAVEGHARAKGWTVRHDEPYAGGYATQAYGRPADAIHAVQVELARRLYLDETNLVLRSGAFEETRTWCRGLVALLGGLGSGPTAFA